MVLINYLKQQILESTKGKLKTKKEKKNWIPSIPFCLTFRNGEAILDSVKIIKQSTFFIIFFFMLYNLNVDLGMPVVLKTLCNDCPSLNFCSAFLQFCARWHDRASMWPVHKSLYKKLLVFKIEPSLSVKKYSHPF